MNATVTVHTLSQRRLTADLLAPRESDCPRMYSKVSSDWLPTYTTATRPVLEIFKMARYFPDSRRIQKKWQLPLCNKITPLTPNDPYRCRTAPLTS